MALFSKMVLNVAICMQWRQGTSVTFQSWLNLAPCSPVHPLIRILSSCSPATSCLLWLSFLYPLWELSLEPRDCSRTQLQMLSSSLQLCLHQLLFCSCGSRQTKFTLQLFLMEGCLRAVSCIILAGSNCHWLSPHTGLSSVWNVLWLALNSVLWVGVFKAEFILGNHIVFG